MIFKAHRKGNILKLLNEDLYRTFIAKLDKDEAYIHITTDRPTRTTQQNRLYWSYLKYIEDETGNDAKALHVYFRDKFLGSERLELNFANRNTFTVAVEATTTDLNTKQFWEYLRKIEREVLIPIPDGEGLKDEL